MMNPNTNRSALFGVVGGYLIYLAYEMLQGMIRHEATTMAPWLTVVFIVLFTGTGLFLLFFAWKTWKKGREDSDQDPVDLAEQEEEAKSEQNGPEKMKTFTPEK